METIELSAEISLLTPVVEPRVASRLMETDRAHFSASEQNGARGLEEGMCVCECVCDE